MIKQYLSNTTESAIVSILQKKLELNKAYKALFSSQKKLQKI